MKHIFYFLLSGILFLCTARPASAAHIVGSMLTYQYVSTNADGTKTWEFELTILRDCGGGGAPFDWRLPMAVYRGDVQNNSLYKIFYVEVLPKISKIEANCPLWPAPNVCFEKGVYQFQMRLPLSLDKSYFVVYQRCCYSESIRNLVDPGDQGLTVYTEITPAAMSANNSSPGIENIPPLYTTRLGGVWFLPKTRNSDGDQIKFRLAAPAAGGGPIISPPLVQSCNGATPDPPCAPPYMPPAYVPGHSGLKPFASNDSINENTGLFTVQSNYLGLYLTGIAMDEYRNNVYLGTTLMQFTIVVGDGSETCFFYTVGADDPADPENMLTVAPSPAQDVAHIRLSAGAREAAFLHVYDAQGKLLQRSTWPPDATEQTLNTAQWPAGLYYALVSDRAGRVYRKGFVKQ